MQKGAKTFGLLFQLALTCLLCIACIAATTIVRLANDGSGRASGGASLSPHNGARLVLADLDGDDKPDTVLVELGNEPSAKTNYSIRLKLSRGMESAIGVDGPIGGLRLSAHDVNGDDNIDLIVTSNLDASFVEILLNDGQGNFSVAAPGDFAWMEKECEEALTSPAGPQADGVTLASVGSSLDDGVVQDCDFDQVFLSSAWPHSKSHRIVRRAALSRQGRSPPISVTLS
ncbi:MAG: hypothetical protein WBQ89_00940 [Candidatus Acidiferrum sp.]